MMYATTLELHWHTVQAEAVLCIHGNASDSKSRFLRVQDGTFHQYLTDKSIQVWFIYRPKPGIPDRQGLLYRRACYGRLSLSHGPSNDIQNRRSHDCASRGTSEFRGNVYRRTRGVHHWGDDEHAPR